MTILAHYFQNCRLIYESGSDNQWWVVVNYFVVAYVVKLHVPEISW